MPERRSLDSRVTRRAMTMHELSRIRGFWLLSAALLLLAPLAAGARPLREAGHLQQIEPEEVLSILIEGGDGPVVIDARAAPLYAKSHIPGAVNVYSKLLWGWIPDLEKYRDRGIILYCESGLNSRRAGLKLLRADFPKVFEMRGHLKRWRALGYPLEVPGSE